MGELIIFVNDQVVDVAVLYDGRLVYVDYDALPSLIVEYSDNDIVFRVLYSLERVLRRLSSFDQVVGVIDDVSVVLGGVLVNYVFVSPEVKNGRFVDNNELLYEEFENVHGRVDIRIVKRIDKIVKTVLKPELHIDVDFDLFGAFDALKGLFGESFNIVLLGGLSVFGGVVDGGFVSLERYRKGTFDVLSQSAVSVNSSLNEVDEYVKHGGSDNFMLNRVIGASLDELVDPLRDVFDYEKDFVVLVYDEVRYSLLLDIFRRLNVVDAQSKDNVYTLYSTYPLSKNSDFEESGLHLVSKLNLLQRE